MSVIFMQEEYLLAIYDNDINGVEQYRVDNWYYKKQ